MHTLASVTEVIWFGVYLSWPTELLKTGQQVLGVGSWVHCTKRSEEPVKGLEDSWYFQHPTRPGSHGLGSGFCFFFPSRISKDLGWKWNVQECNWCSYVMPQCHWLNLQNYNSNVGMGWTLFVCHLKTSHEGTTFVYRFWLRCSTCTFFWSRM